MDKNNFGQGEQIISAVPVRMKTGLFSSETYHLVMTNRRFIFALFDKETFQNEVLKATEEAKKEGKNIWGRLYTAMETGSIYSQRYLVMQPQEILEENNDNFYCDHRLINQIELKKTRNGYHSDGEYKGQEAPRIVIKTSDLTYKLEVQPKADINDFRNQVKEIFSKKYKEK